MSVDPRLSPDREEFISNIALDIVFTVFSCGLFNVYVKWRQIMATNVMLGYKRYSFTKWSLLSLITCGIYHLYFEYISARDVVQVYGDPDSSEPLLCLILAIFGLPIIADAIIQNRINKFFGGNPV